MNVEVVFLVLSILLFGRDSILIKLNFFTNREEAEEYINIGTINGLFVLGRSMGFIGE